MSKHSFMCAIVHEHRHSSLHYYSNAVINRFFFLRAVGRLHVRSSEFGFHTTKQLHRLTCTMSQCIVLLKDVNLIGDASDGWQ